MKTSIASICWWGDYDKIGDVSVIGVDLTPDAVRESEAFSWLCSEERVRWNGFQFAGPRRQFVLTRAALRAVLCDRLECDNQQLTFGYTQYGKPFALTSGNPADISFNVSHSGRYGLLALAPEGHVGVDVEERVVRHDMDALGSAVFSPNEQAELAMASGQAKSRLFLDLWAIKEALIKAIGTGFYRNPALLEIPSPMRHGHREGLFDFPDLPGVKWRLNNLGTESFAAAVAHERNLNPVPVPEAGE